MSMNSNLQATRELPRIMILHGMKLAFRLLLLLAAAFVYFTGWFGTSVSPTQGPEKHSFLLTVIWVYFFVEMAARFFPSKMESMGCQKQFAQNYVPQKRRDGPPVKRQSARVTFLVAAVWIIFNAVIAALYFAQWIDAGFMLLVSLGYSVCDKICVLFFCPFQIWLMKNKCCTSCRIYNWDFAMMFTPMIFVGGVYGLSLFLPALALLIHWETAYRRYPERFSEDSNASLACAGCPEKLCQHKKQMYRLYEQKRARHKDVRTAG
ncbi:MAG: hypothetical protein PHD67_08850 [Oscillospiraceae bacterium]|nr:hypothetical protein [Oscillospiraceae bacterium]